MTTLETQQRGVLAIIKRRPPNASLNTVADPWLQRIAGSREARMVSEIALWWRRFQIDSLCRYTSRLLKREGCYEAEVEKYFNDNSTSPYIEKLASGFLGSLARHPNQLTANVATFELACLEMVQSNKRWRINWDRDPEATIKALDERAPLPARDDHYLHVMELGRDIPGGAACVLVSRH